MATRGRAAHGEHDGRGRVPPVRRDLNVSAGGCIPPKGLEPSMGSATSGIRPTRRPWPYALLVVAAAVTVARLLTGCGDSSAAPEAVASTTVASIPPTSASPTTLHPPVAATPRPSTEWVSTPEEITQALREASLVTTGLRLYAPAQVPSGTRVAPRWTDALAAPGTPSTVTAASNPRISGSGATAEVGLVFEVGNGRVSFIQNVHGDLGDLPGRPVGSIEGHLATAYRMLGANVVQWEDEGHWYAVMGTGLAGSDVERIALSMRPL